jgi:hypothetical protein
MGPFFTAFNIIKHPIKRLHLQSQIMVFPGKHLPFQAIKADLRDPVPLLVIKRQKTNIARVR